jgi:NNP family nitrate/nitrite transporter-like MFS transporter
MSRPALAEPQTAPARWEPEDEAFWQEEGSRSARRNLLISIPCLTCAFAVWMYWSVVTVQMQNLGFPFTRDQLYTLTAIAGLAGATLRIPNSFLVAVAGGRNVVALTTALLVLPALGAGIALRDGTTTFSTFAVLAALSGIGGGAFSSSMSNISFFYPRRVQGTSLGLNAGIGNLGVSLMQVLLPYVSTFALFGALGGDPFPMKLTVGYLAAGTPIWIQNCGLVWVPILAVLAIVAWIGMDNLPIHRVGSTAAALARASWLELLGLAGTALGVWLLLGLGWNMWIVLPVTIVVTVAALRVLTPKAVRENLARQYAIFRNRHNWVMTWLYVMTFGSFIGYSAAFPKLIQDVFGRLGDGSVNPNAPRPLAYAWLGPLVGSLARPAGGWLADRLGGARVTQWATAAMIATALGVAYVVKTAGSAARPEEHFGWFLALFLVLFVMTGIGNGSTFRMVPMIFGPAQAGPVLGWTGAVAAYGAFVVPKVFGAQIEAHTPQYAFYGFAVYYATCLVVNWWFYARKGAEVRC